ncbi:MAG: DUF6939 family protein [Flammeovirgaceae bacterium]
MIYVENKRKKLINLQKQYPNAIIIDLTSKAEEPYVKFSPFYPHGDIPVPFSAGITAQSVEGIWQGLKVFQGVDIDTSKFEITTMKGLKRTVRKFGIPRGHRKGVSGTALLDYITARKLIYLPIFDWVLQHKLANLLKELHELSKKQDLVFLDYETNGDVDDPNKPLSHAYLVKYAIERLE